MDNDLNKCPKCGGPADNGHDRCVPPSAYVCSCCDDKAWLDTKPNLKHIEEIGEPERMFKLAYEAIDLRREKYKLEAVIEKMFKLWLHKKTCPHEGAGFCPTNQKTGLPLTCRECLSEYVEYEL